MLLNDMIDHDKAKNMDITRNLKNATTRHYQNNPHVSMEAAFAYIMSNSGIFRALPTACIDKARRYLALPETDKDQATKHLHDVVEFPIFIIPVGPTNPQGMTPIGWKHTISDDSADTLESIGVPSSDGKGDPDMQVISIPRLNKDRLAEFINIVTLNVNPHESLGHTFGRIRRESTEFTQMHPIDIHNAWTQLTGMQANKPKPSTTVVHAERVVVDNRKMIKILEFENVYLANGVPVDYLKEPPYYILERDVSTKYILLTVSDYLIDSMVIKVDDLMTIKDFGKMIKTMKEAAARLSKINKTAKLERGHSGKFTVSI